MYFVVYLGRLITDKTVVGGKPGTAWNYEIRCYLGNVGSILC